MNRTQRARGLGVDGQDRKEEDRIGQDKRPRA